MKRSTIALIATILLLVIAGGIFFLLTNNRKNENITEVKAASVKKLVDETPISAVASFDGTAIWYFTQEGRLLRVTVDGVGRDEYPLPPITGLSRVLWPATGNDFIAVTQTTQGEKKYYYDSNLKKYVTLPDGIKSFAWMPDGKRIIYVWQTAEGKNQLGLSNADASGYRILRDLNASGYIVKPSSNGRDVLMMTSQITNGIAKIINYNLSDNNFTVLVDNGKNTGGFWLPDGKKFVFTRVTEGTYPSVFLYSMVDHEAIDLKVSASSDRMAYDKEGRFIYAAITKNSGVGAKLVKINTETHITEDFYVPDTEIRMKNLVYASGTIYFTDMRDNKMYYISK